MRGRKVGHYVIQEEIGEGGMGEVYRAEDPRTGRSVAIKTLRSEYHQTPLIVARFLNEAKATRTISNAHIVSVLDTGEMDDGTPYIVMEWLSGRSLAALLRADPFQPLHRTLHIIASVGRALVAAHAHGVIHRDLKPDNIFLIHNGEDEHFVKVLDFGLAKMLQPNAQALLRTDPCAVFGTPAYMSPEQCRGAHEVIDQRSDIYALGVILYEMAVGRRPFVARDFPSLVLAHLREEPPAPCSLQPLLPAAVEAIILRALAKPPELRFQTMEEFLHTLSEVAVTEFSPAPIVTPGAPAAAVPVSNDPRASASSTGAAAAPSRVTGSHPTILERPDPTGVMQHAQKEASSRGRRSSRRSLVVVGYMAVGLLALVTLALAFGLRGTEGRSTSTRQALPQAQAKMR